MFFWLESGPSFHYLFFHFTLPVNQQNYEYSSFNTLAAVMSHPLWIYCGIGETYYKAAIHILHIMGPFCHLFQKSPPKSTIMIMWCLFIKSHLWSHSRFAAKYFDFPFDIFVVTKYPLILTKIILEYKSPNEKKSICLFLEPPLSLFSFSK